jgi:Trk K+ transport system NAD-binding subunit
MQRIPRSYRRLFTLLLFLPVLVVVLAFLYHAGMYYLEGQPRSIGESLQWAAATLTTTGYGRDATWTHPVMEIYVIFAEFAGVLLLFLVFPVFVIPFLEERFEARLPSALPDLADHVLVYRYGPAVTSLLEELDHAGVPAVIFEEDETTARRLHEHEHSVVLGSLEEDDPDLSNLVGARGLVLNGDDDDNAAMTLSARYHGFQGPIIALIDNPSRRHPLIRAGATIAFTPDHVLAAAIAARASVKISPRLSSVRQLGQHLQVAELRVHAASPLAGKTIAEVGIRAQTGATVVGLWSGGSLVRQPSISTPIAVGLILVAVGSQQSIERLGELATPVRREGVFVVVGYGYVGRKVAELLRAAGETVSILNPEPAEGVDFAGDVLDPGVLQEAGVAQAQAVILSLETDSATLFASAVVRNLAPEIVIIAAANRAENVSRIHRAGADFALSVGQVAGQLLAYHLLGQESVSLEAEIKLVATAPGSLAGRPLAVTWVRERTGCSIVAVERGAQVIVELGERFELEPTDVVYISGTNETIGDYFKAFPGTQVSPVRRRPSEYVEGVAGE